MTSAVTGILLLLAGAAAAVGAVLGFSGGSRSVDPRIGTELRHGGLVIVLRHAVADSSAPARPGCEDQPNLTAHGRAEALAIRSAFARVSAPVGSLVVSPLCRARETARLAFPGVTEAVRPDLVRTASDGTATWRRKVRDVRRLLGLKPRPGTDRVVVTHSEVVSAATGEDVAEGEGLVLRPLGGGRFAVLDRIAPEDWKSLKPGAQ